MEILIYSLIAIAVIAEICSISVLVKNYAIKKNKKYWKESPFTLAWVCIHSIIIWTTVETSIITWLGKMANNEPYMWFDWLWAVVLGLFTLVIIIFGIIHDIKAKKNGIQTKFNTGLLIFWWIVILLVTALLTWAIYTRILPVMNFLTMNIR